MKLAPWNDIFIKRLINFLGLQCTQPHFCEFSELFESLVLTNGGQSIIPGWKSSSDIIGHYLRRDEGKVISA